MIAVWLVVGISVGACQGCDASPTIRESSAIDTSAPSSSAPASDAESSAGDAQPSSNDAQPSPNDAQPSPAAVATSADAAPSALSAWWSGGANAVFTAISADDTDISTAASKADVGGLQSACRALQSDVEQAQAYPPAPDPVVQSGLTEALAMYARSATDCIAGTTTKSPALIEQAANEMHQGTVIVEQATSGIRSLG
jgi:hypothetical protein